MLNAAKSRYSSGKNSYRRILLILLTIIPILSGLTAEAQWVRVNNGLGIITVISLAVIGNNVFAGTGVSNGIYLSTNNGTSWTQTSLNNREVNSLAVNGNYIFAGTAYYGVYLSTNNGTSWTQTSLNNQWILSLAVSGNNVLAGTEQHGVYVSNDNGTSWTQRNEGLGNITIFDLCILNNYIFTGTKDSSVYRRPLDELIGN